MERIRMTFPSGSVVQARILTDEEPELGVKLLSRLSGPLELVCNHAVSAGEIFDAYARPAQEPEYEGAGRHPVSFSQTEPGDILWDGERLRIVYGEAAQPGIAGCVVAKAEADEAFEKACTSIWHHIYREHIIPVITVIREESGK